MKSKGSSSSRRKFLSLGFLGGASLITQSLQGQDIVPGDDETVSMLTPDGKLVQVKKTIVDHSEKKQRARNADILNWMKTGKKVSDENQKPG